jgi:predicted O-methyltransferase YrrM
MKDWIAELFGDTDLTRMGHAQRVDDLNLGLGWIYYGLARTMRPAVAVVIGSYRGFVPLMLGKALADNGEGGQVHFIDPSYVDDFWKDAAAVNAHFARYGLSNVQHYLMTTQQFVESAAYRELGAPGIVFIDGYHTQEQVRFDYESFRYRLGADGVTLFHDTRYVKPSRMYGPDRVYTRTVRYFIDELKQDPALQVLDMPFGDGLTLVRRAETPA